LIRYCYGAKIVVDLNLAGLTDCTAVAHPSMISKADLTNLKTPISFALAEADDQFSPPMAEYTQVTLKEKNLPFELEVYEGTCHGFASRGDLTIEKVKKGCEGSIVQAVNWYKKYLA
jgi:dienelactone hydrolase